MVWPDRPTQNGCMATNFAHPAARRSPDRVVGSVPTAFTVGEAQRERAVAVLQQRYSQGVLSHYEFTDRLDLAMRATTMMQINTALAGLGGALAARPPLFDTTERGRTGRAMATMAHASALGTSIVGPGFIYAVSPRGSYAKHEAAKAFNFQLLSIICLTLAIIGVSTHLLPGGVIAVGAVVWFVSTIVGAIRAAEGERLRNPIARVLPLRVLDEGPQRPRRVRHRQLGA